MGRGHPQLFASVADRRRVQGVAMAAAGHGAMVDSGAARVAGVAQRGGRLSVLCVEQAQQMVGVYGGHGVVLVLHGIEDAVEYG